MLNVTIFKINGFFVLGEVTNNHAEVEIKLMFYVT